MLLSIFALRHEYLTKFQIRRWFLSFEIYFMYCIMVMSIDHLLDFVLFDNVV